jgi:deoxyribodipyrimidine photolyase
VEWFHDTLVDADLAINGMMWQNAVRANIAYCPLFPPFMYFISNQ